MRLIQEAGGNPSQGLGWGLLEENIGEGRPIQLLATRIDLGGSREMGSNAQQRPAQCGFVAHDSKASGLSHAWETLCIHLFIGG